ncbi:MAG: imidazole glycerol phosphate synthase subunit HisH [Leptospiraceae bacterium]|nr:imidazole glycerol phosphate synthase subunit HisH [Leptospiraceae bacterium]MCK6382546.1 imidazole glycerol phosphate synthase subunit HisH [Leptospiraceae bacterium]NUM41589.1 imidazole glycerol phosphate synthase subunit HisH [Leptospiraceae bacterium]
MIAVIDFGMGNIHSCLKAISLFTKDFKLVTDPMELKNAKGVILPGDGAFEKAMQNLKSMKMKDALDEYVYYEKPIFGICIGFQILFENSEESTIKDNIVPGFGWIHGNIKRFKGKIYKVPHMGWNKIHFATRKKVSLLDGVADRSYMYFIHSYRPTNVEEDSVLATCSYYEESFPVVVEKNNIFGTQFHPEKSDTTGLKILQNFIGIANS